MVQLKGRDKDRYLAGMFGRVSGHYDRLNNVMTAGRHHAWRKLAAIQAAGGAAGPALDVATGTGDFALELARHNSITHVVGLDIAPEMLAVAAGKTKKTRLDGRIAYLVGDAHNLPFPDFSFTAVTAGFGVRNFSDLPGALREMAQVLHPGGRIVVLEIVRSGDNDVGGWFFTKLFRLVPPLLGAILARDRESYSYLPDSVEAFRSANELKTMVEEAGLSDVTVKKLALGNVAIVSGSKAS